jgi:hypothetical protein
MEIQFKLNSADEIAYNSTDANDLDPEITISNMAYVMELHQLPASYSQTVMQHINQQGLDYMIPSWEIHNFSLTTDQSYEQTIANNSKSVKAVYFMQRASANVNKVDSDYSFITDSLDSFQLRIGSEFYPLEECHVGAQSWGELVKALQRENNPAVSNQYNITKAEYASGKSYFGIDLEKFITSNSVSGTDFSENEITLKLSYSSAPAATGNRVYVYVYRDAKFSINANHRISYVF